MFETQTEAFATGWLQGEADACWTWDADGEVIVWIDGTTLMFREEFAQLIERLLPRKVPATAGLLILLLAAAKGKIPAGADLDDDLLPVLGQLGELAKLPPDLVAGVAAKAHLVEYFTEDLPALSETQGQAVLGKLREGIPLLHLLPDSSSPFLLAHHLRLLRPALHRMNAEELRQRLVTGLDAPPEAAEWEPVPAQVAKLLSELRQESEFAGLVQLVKDVMAAISLPQALAAPEVNALGGLSDISNRGPLHRLLISELAHDHEVLTMRLALGEALYLKNEPPAIAPLSELVVLMDSGIRMWGAPRVFATAIALALLAKAPKRQVTQTYRAELAGVAATDLCRKAGLVQHLAALELNEHPAASLRHLIAQFSPKQRVDLVVITHERVLDDPEFRLPRELPDDTHLHFIVVNREGDLSMSLVTPQGYRPLKQAKLDLSRLLPEHAEQVLDTRGRLPAIFRQEPFPFLLVPPELIGDLSLATDNYCAGLSRTGTIWHWSSAKAGAIRLPVPAIPGTPIIFTHDETADSLVLLKHHADQLRLLRWFDGPDGTIDVKEIKEVPRIPKSTFRRNGLLHVLYDDQADVIDIISGRVLARVAVPNGLEKIGEGFYRQSGREIGSLAWNGQSLAWEPIETEFSKIRFQIGRVQRVFHRQGLDGPWLLDEDGNVLQACPPYKHRKIGWEQGAKLKVSPDGHAIKAEKIRSIIISLKEGSSALMPDWEKRVHTPHWSIRTNFTHIACEASGHLVLRSRKGYWLRIQLNSRSEAFHFSAVRGDEPVSAKDFKAIASPAEVDLSLSEAFWPASGSRAILDRRGLLHLQSGMAHIPEVSIMLAESNSLPVWSSDGSIVGPAFFVGGKGQTNDAARIDGIIRSFIEAA